MPIELNAFEREAMQFLLAGDDPRLNVLRVQYSSAHPVRRELSGAGFHLSFSVSADVPRLDGRKSLDFGDVQAQIEGLQCGAGFVLHVRDGAIDSLEGYSYDEPWPTNVQSFRLSYVEGDQRDLAALWSKWA